MLFLTPFLGRAQKTDTVTFFNGDRAVCEIKGLDQGKLLIKTVAMGTISVEWRNVADVRSNQYFEIILSDHTTFFGRVDGVDSLRNALIYFGIFSQNVPLQDIVSLQPIKKKFWASLDGSLSIGLSYTKATQNLQFNSKGDVSHRTNKTLNTISFSTNLSENQTTISEKHDGGYRFQYTYKRRIYNAFGLRWERNTELGINSRVITTLSGGFNPIENRFSVLSIELGASANEEFTTEDSTLYNVEGLVRLKYNLFIFSNPKIFIDIESVTYPSFTIQGRIRSDSNVTIKWEVFNNFTFDLSFWGSYDSKPADPTALNFDWGSTAGIGYTF
jgi:hypothetical protein